jgi:hypothetical protein
MIEINKEKNGELEFMILVSIIMRRFSILYVLLFLNLVGSAQSALEVQGGTKAMSFEHWYFTTIDSINPRLEFFNYTNAIFSHSGERINSTLINPYLGYNLYKGIGIAGSVTFQNSYVSPYLGIQFSKSNNSHNFFSILSYSPSNKGKTEYFLWYIFQPSKQQWNPFLQLNLLSNSGKKHNFTQLKIRIGPSYKSHAFGFALDADWDTDWKLIENYGIFYRIKLSK